MRILFSVLQPSAQTGGLRRVTTAFNQQSELQQRFAAIWVEVKRAAQSPLRLRLAPKGTENCRKQQIARTIRPPFGNHLFARPYSLLQLSAVSEPPCFRPAV